ncbi:coiled-coil domain-containing protein [Musa troglodytarum]|uniref:Coiled-coil domain-containing protein n=1 Tax=Musa troglodytarum TaxID=320322 RepID=A0A9E7KNT0_9LILI|nr:coiled-coil domain-containing protein [Musa troglodytarum]
MSSLAAARADNFYYPPEWDPKKGSLNKFQGQHPLRERARKLDQGILIIRFEMPFNIWCGGCNSMIAKGVRFNAEKKQVGNYYSTKGALHIQMKNGLLALRLMQIGKLHVLKKEIWSFTMKSACCKHEIVIQTDPKNCEYVIISGAQRKTEDYDIEDAETFALPADEVMCFFFSASFYLASTTVSVKRGKLADPFYRLEHQEEDLRKKKEVEPLLVRLQRVSDSRHADDYSLNRALRARLRNQKRRVEEEERVSRRMGLGIRLLPPSEEDAAVTATVRFASKFDRNRKNKRAAIMASSIFPDSSVSASGSKRSELESKRRKIKATAASASLAGRVKPLSRQHGAGFAKR